MTKLTSASLKKFTKLAMETTIGHTADYIPELTKVPEDLMAISVQAINEKEVNYQNFDYDLVTLQSTSKLIPLIGLLEDFGAEKVFSWVRAEPSGDDFASVARLDQFGPKPSNPMLNAGAITLCSHIPGKGEDRLAWLDKWIHILFKQKLSVNNLVLTSEKRTGDRNRSLAYLLKSQGNIHGNVDDILELYFTLCSYQAKANQLIALPYILANSGKDFEGNQVLSLDTVKYTLAIMATCGLYNESGAHMLRTGMPAKSGVSGYIIAVVPNKAGLVVLSPKVNQKGNSVRGSIVLEQISRHQQWHFAIN